ncbi:unnamed protein product [Phytomonas sp. EM1]|nr:unnamed protein product [Phytomonas sp. EM1]|eukprot:CCW61686.1 unnamed protein product [Phytomonas sp. isolate EM1]
MCSSSLDSCLEYMIHYSRIFNREITVA